MIGLEQLNNLAAGEFTAALGAVFEHSPWVAQGVAALRPFGSGVALHQAMCAAVMRADDELQLALIRAHPELAGRASLQGSLTAASTQEQKSAGLSACSPQQLQRLHLLNAEYGRRFGFPFVLAVRGHTADSVIAALTARMAHRAAEERLVALQEICRIARFRLADLVDEPLGAAVLGMIDALAVLTEDAGALTCSYLSDAHLATANLIRDFMLAAGLDVHIDAVGNVVGILQGDGRISRRVLTGSHYDTVINAGKYDGRLGIALPIAAAASLRRRGATLPYPLEIIAFAEEEGVRFRSTFLGSSAVAGCFDRAALDRTDAAGRMLRDAMQAACRDPAAIAAIARDPAQVLCFVEVHIEQGPALLEAGLPAGVVTAIAGSVRSVLTIEGMAGHAGTVPMSLRRDAAAAAAEIVLAVERRCRADEELVGTVGKLEVPGGAVNVIPGRCEMSIDIRSADDALRSAADADIRAEILRIAARRGVAVEQCTVLAAASVPCTPALQDAWAASIERIAGGTALRLPSGAGHDAMVMASIAAMGMLFVRCGNGGISHDPRETVTVDDADVAARVFTDFLQHIVDSENHG